MHNPIDLCLFKSFRFQLYRKAHEKLLLYKLKYLTFNNDIQRFKSNYYYYTFKCANGQIKPIEIYSNYKNL